jgi:hypothetical protein
MSDAVPLLPGDPPQWPATIRDLLGTAADGGLDRATAREALAGDPQPGAGTAERRLAFLEAAAVLTCEDGTCTPARYGQEYLRTHDESVLYAALDDVADGFGTVLDGLAVRPLSDVEVADLLSAERDGDVDAATAGRYLAWLRALGYLTREDGVNDLTRSGRRLVATTDGITPPGTDDAPTERPDRSGPGTTDAAGDAVGTATPEPRSHPVDGTVDVDQGPPTATTDSADADGSGTEAVVVDADLEGALRARYDDTCMLCGERRRRRPEAGHAEVHFLMPRTAPHDGPTAAANALVVCPNHRADLEHGAVTIDPRTLTIDHAYEAAVTGRVLRTVEDHAVGAQYLAYHNDVIAGDRWSASPD